MGHSTFTLDDYIITKDGKIISKKRGGKEVKPQPNGKGYLRVHIAGKMYFVHRLVAEKYVPNPDGKPQVNHKDGDKTNNRADNLEWVTNKENRSHALKNGLHTKGDDCSWAKLTREQVEFIRNHPEIKNAELARTFGVHHKTISAVKYKRTWKD